MKLGEKNYLMRWVFSPRFIRIGKKCGFFTWALRFQNRISYKITTLPILRSLFAPMLASVEDKAGIEEAVAEAVGIPQASFPPSTVVESPWASARGDQGSFETIVSENEMDHQKRKKSKSNFCKYARQYQSWLFGTCDGCCNPFYWRIHGLCRAVGTGGAGQITRYKSALKLDFNHSWFTVCTPWF